MGTDWYLIAAICLIAFSFAAIIGLTLHSARGIAAHEAGHAVFHWISPASGGVEKVVAGAFSGAAHIFEGHYRPRRIAQLLGITGHLSGYAGEVVLHGSCHPCKSDTDLKRAVEDAEKAVEYYSGLRDDLARAASEAPVSIRRAKRVFAAFASPAAADLMTVLLAACIRLLEKNRPGLAAVNRSLSWRRHLSADRLREILGRRPTRDEFWRQLRDEPSL